MSLCPCRLSFDLSPSTAVVAGCPVPEFTSLPWLCFVLHHNLMCCVVPCYAMLCCAGADRQPGPRHPRLLLLGGRAPQWQEGLWTAVQDQQEHEGTVRW